MPRLRTAPEDVHVHLAVFTRILASGRRPGIVERPVPRLPIVDAASEELRQRLEHRLPRRGDEEAPRRELRGRKLEALPDGARGIDDEMSAIGAIVEDGH